MSYGFKTLSDKSYYNYYKDYTNNTQIDVPEKSSNR